MSRATIISHLSLPDQKEHVLGDFKEETGF
jgi:hypothetical protein